jgi:hypothetical protein
VLLHHTFDPKYCDYRGPGIKNDASTILSVDLLYYEDRLLKCPHNKRGLKQVLDVVGRPSSKVNDYDTLVIHFNDADWHPCKSFQPLETFAN